MELRDKKVLQMGLGILGGGIATAKWLLEKGAVLTITDLKDAAHLKPSLQKLKEFESKIKYVLGEHGEKDFLENDIIVINPDVPADNKFFKLAREARKEIENELTLFYKFSKCKNSVGITGTRGKTTATNWTGHILKTSGGEVKVLGNDPEKPLLGEIKNCGAETLAVIEQPSYLLEIFGESGFAPHVAVITNLYRDHINRHKTMEGYARTKANIFINQTKDDFLILNQNNKWTDFFLGLEPLSKVLFFSNSELPLDKDGAFVDSEGDIIIRLEGKEKKIMPAHGFVKEWGSHNLENLLSAALVSFVQGISPEDIEKASRLLPQIKLRQEKTHSSPSLDIYNDSAATSPEATIALLERFKGLGLNLILISGGTDKELEFKEWADTVKGIVKPENLFLISGSATEKMKKELGWEKFNESGTLKECLISALEKARKYQNKGIIFFSPSSKSFEKFKNEFDRGEQFNLLVKELFK